MLYFVKTFLHKFKGVITQAHVTYGNPSQLTKSVFMIAVEIVVKRCL